MVSNQGDENEIDDEDELSPEEEFQLAVDAAGEGDFGHALHHLSEALAEEPGRPQWRALLDLIIREAPGEPLELLPEGGDRYYGDEALRAYMLAARGQMNEALGIISQVVQAHQDNEYIEAWVLGWLEPEEALQSIEPQVFNLIMGLFFLKYPEFHRVLPGQEPLLEQGLGLLNRYRGEAETLTIWRTGLLRKLGRFAEAIESGRANFEANPNYNTAIALAGALRHNDEVEDAVEYYKKALELNPGDFSAACDVGDLYMEVENWEHALHWYQVVLSADQSNTWAMYSSLFCQYKMSGADADFANFVQTAQSDPGSERARALLNLLYPFEGFLPDPSDATVGVLKQAMETLKDAVNAEPGAEIEIKADSLEAPSNRLAFELAMGVLDAPLKLKMITESVPTPDPRESLMETTFRLWEYEDTEPRVTVPAPSAETVAVVVELARRPYNPEMNRRVAARLALLPGAQELEAVAAVMVHPPAVPQDLKDQVDAFQWLSRIQLAAAQIILQAREAWPESKRREILLSIALGPTDWVTSAVVLAMSSSAGDDPGIAYDCRQLFKQLYLNLPDTGYACYLGPLAARWALLPGLEPDEQQLTRALYEQTFYGGAEEEA